uniref:Optineurin n=1 Tax=Cynoglossus semilaevis TaxID=244447 RepID=A0A3P8WUX8_CYNSE
CSGSVSQPSVSSCTLEETLQQMNVLIQENRELKEALRQTNLTMKERFEGLSAWREKQREERNFLESRLEEATVTSVTSDLTPALQVQTAELEGLRGQIVRLQAEKNDLVAMNSELRLKADESLDSFIEVIRAHGSLGDSSPEQSSTLSPLDNKDMTVSQLLLSLRKERQRGDQLQEELQRSATTLGRTRSTSSSSLLSTASSWSSTVRFFMFQAASEVENLKSQVMSLYKELQQAQSKLNQAEGMKKNLQDRYREVEQDVVTLRAQLVENQTIRSENDRLKLQLDSMQVQNQLEQKKAGEERNNLCQLKDAYTKLFEDYTELKEEEGKKKKEECSLVDDLQARLTAAEEALASKQAKMDDMKQELFQKEKELETVSVFQAQAEVYSSDFYAERAAREKLHEEKERLAAQLEYVKKQNSQLQEEVDSLGRHSLNEMQRRHVSLGGNQHGPAATLAGRGSDWQHQDYIPEHACPKCNEILPDLDSLQIHIMDCIN